MNKFVRAGATLAVFLGASLGCGVAGFHAGPAIVKVWRGMFPEPEYAVSDYAGLRATAGTPVVLIATSTCPYCRQAAALLDSLDVKYKRYDVDVDPGTLALVERYAEPGGFVPQVFIGDVRVVGFREATLRRLIEEHRASARAEKG